MDIWRFIPRKFLARYTHPLAVRFIAWRLNRSIHSGIVPVWINPNL